VRDGISRGGNRYLFFLCRIDLRSFRYLCFVIFFFLFFTTLLMKLKDPQISIGLENDDARNGAFVYIIYLIRHIIREFSPDPLDSLSRQKVSIS
jgi:hypothetical protein